MHSAKIDIATGNSYRYLHEVNKYHFKKKKKMRKCNENKHKRIAIMMRKKTRMNNRIFNFPAIECLLTSIHTRGWARIHTPTHTNTGKWSEKNCEIKNMDHWWSTISCIEYDEVETIFLWNISYQFFLFFSILNIFFSCSQFMLHALPKHILKIQLISIQK